MAVAKKFLTVWKKAAFSTYCQELIKKQKNLIKEKKGKKPNILLEL